MTTILIIDDEEMIRRSLKRLLNMDGYDVCLAEDGIEGLKVFIEKKPEVVILDIKMPRIDGREVLKLLKKEKWHSEVIMVTGHGDVDSAIDAMKSGASSYLRKPVNYDELEIEIKKAVNLINMKKNLDNYMQELKSRNKDLERIHGELESIYQYLRHEYDIAARIFHKIIQHKDLTFKNVKILSAPMDIVCGDIALISRKPTGGLYVLVGDFTGHGLSAAIGAIPVSDIFYTMTSKCYSLKKIVSEINSALKQKLPTGLFLATCLIEIDYHHNNIRFFNAGLPDIITVHSLKF
ncbi:MAG: response regulator [Desulfobacterales bacterium]|nr:response regulator [Desulfobacterales bacterium]